MLSRSPLDRVWGCGGDPYQKLGQPLRSLGSFSLSQQFGTRNAQRVRDPQQEADSWLALPPFKSSEVGPVHAGSQGEGILSDALLLPAPSDCRANRMSNVWIERWRAGSGCLLRRGFRGCHPMSIPAVCQLGHGL